MSLFWRLAKRNIFSNMRNVLASLLKLSQVICVTRCNSLQSEKIPPCHHEASRVSIATLESWPHVARALKRKGVMLTPCTPSSCALHHESRRREVRAISTRWYGLDVLACLVPDFRDPSIGCRTCVEVSNSMRLARVLTLVSACLSIHQAVAMQHIG